MSTNTPWFKFYGQAYLSDTKIEILNAIERSCWVTLLCLASTTEDGVLYFIERESLARKSGIQWDPYDTKDWDCALASLDKFERMKMVELDHSDGSVRIINWSKRQEQVTTSAERMRKLRANNKDLSDDVTKSDKSASHIRHNVTVEVEVEEEVEVDNTHTSTTAQAEPSLEGDLDIIKANMSNNLKLDVALDFEKFWVLYPRKTGKQPAMKAWMRLKEKNRKLALEALSVHCAMEQWVKDNGKFIPHAATWLNQSRWEDEISLPKPQEPINRVYK